MTEPTSTRTRLEAFARAILNDNGVGLQGPDGLAQITRADIFDVLSDLEAAESTADQQQGEMAYAAAVTADLGAYIAELQQAGEDFDPRLLAILEQREEEDGEGHDPELVSLVTNSLHMLGLETAGEIQATALLEVIYRFTMNQSPGAHAAPESPMPQTLLQSAPSPPSTLARRPGAKLVATPVAPAPPTLSDIARFTPTGPRPERPAPPVVTAADLLGLDRSGTGRYDAGGL